MIQPEALRQSKPWLWSPGIGLDVWEMFCACIVGDLDGVRRLVARDPSLVRAHYEYRTPLSFAVRENRIEVAEFLLDHSAGPPGLGNVLEMARDRGYTRMTALLEQKLADLHGASSAGEIVASAIRDRDLDRVRRILDEFPELLHAGDERSNQPIHWAVMTRQLPMIDELLVRGADINARRADGARPIQLTNGDYHYRGWRDVPEGVATTPDDVFRHLVARKVDVDVGMAAYKGDIARVRELVDRDPSIANRVDPYNSYYPGCGAPLKNGAVGGHLEIVRLLLERGADPNLAEEGIAPHGHALYSAVYHGHYEIARLLLEHGAYPNPEVESSADAVWIAIRNGDARMLQLLGGYGATWKIPNSLDGPLTYEGIVATGVGRAINVLAYYGDLAAAEPLLADNPALADDPEVLAAAAGQGFEAFVRLLLQHRPDLARRVTVARPREMALLLFQQGMDPNRPNWLGATPLHHFAANGQLEDAALFLDHGADLHARDEEWRSTPLAWAAREGQTRLVEFLLRRGAKTTLPDYPPWATPRAWATKRGHAGIVRLLDEYEMSGVLPPRQLERYEALARDLVDAYCKSADASETSLALDSARWLIARSEGFDRWDDLVKEVDA